MSVFSMRILKDSKGLALRVKPSKNLTLAGFVASLQNLTEVVSHLSFHVLLLAL